jgi:F0F1-type ATP synthase membrane subunit b/b'
MRESINVSKGIDEMLQDAQDNINNDRALATKLLSEVMKHLAKDSANHQHAGSVAAKYLETLQRSNEQLVKIAALKSKDRTQKGLSDVDKSELYDLIKGE